MNYEEKQNLYKIFKEYGQVSKAKEIAKKIVSHRKTKPIKSTTDLIKVLEKNIK